MDKSSMKELVEHFADQLREAVAIGRAAKLAPAQRPIHNVAVLGLGGSAFGGEIVRNTIYDTGSVPVVIYRGYTLPKNIDQHTLAIVSSYSGNTEETLDTAAAAKAQGAQIVVVTSGGKILEWAKENGYSYILLPGGYPPRSAAGFSSVQQLYVLKHFGLIADFEADLQEAITVLDHFSAEDKQATETLAKSLHEKAVVIYTSDSIDSIAIRLRQQINENSKQLCWHHTIPEMNHNELVGWENPRFLIEKAVVLYLRSSYDHPRVNIRFDICKDIITKQGAHVVEIHAKGKSKLAQIIYLLHYSDLISLHLATANQVDPLPVKVIDFLKAELGKR